jgi:acetyltransferase
MATGGGQKKERFIAGDPMRGIACLVVLFWHTAVASAGIVSPMGISPGMKSELGILGPPVVTLAISVWFFFVLSGYLISGPFVRAVVRGDGRKPRLRPYAINRLLRIVPGFWAILTLTILLVGTEGNSLKQMVEFYGFGHIYDQGPFTERMVQAWTLDVEVVFYALVPFILLPLATLLRGRWTPWARAGVILAGCAVVGAASIALGEAGPKSGSIVPGAMWAFTPGIALATIEPLVKPHLSGRAFGRWIAWALMATFALAFLYYTYRVNVFDAKLQNLVAAVACGAFLAGPLVLQWSGARTWRIFDNRFLHWFGIRAYGVYLTHVVVIYELRYFIRDLGTVPLALLFAFPLIMLLSTLAGALSFRYIESPFLERRLPWRSPEPARETRAPAQQVAVTPPVPATEVVGAP